jgi:hypothetical protein
MSARWTICVVGFMGVLLCGALLATAAAPSVGQNRSPLPGSRGTIEISKLVGMTVLDPQGQKLGRIKDVLLDSRTGQTTFVVLDAEAFGAGHPMTYSAARPIQNPSIPAPSLPPSAVAAPSPAPSVMPPPCVRSADSGLTKDLEDFYNE